MCCFSQVNCRLWRLFYRGFLTAIVLTVMSACTYNKVNYGSGDNYLMDKTVNELQKDTCTFFAKIKVAESKERSYKKYKWFYASVEGRLSALVMRAEVIEKGMSEKPLVSSLKDLKEQFAGLADVHLHEEKPSQKYFEEAEAKLQKSFRHLLELIIGHEVK